MRSGCRRSVKSSHAKSHRIQRPQKMHIELIDFLRCPRPHAFTWLVARTAQIRERDVVGGMLGCPECRARYPLVAGVLDLRSRPTPVAALPFAEPEDETITRLAALLAVADAPSGALMVLAGEHAAAARVMSRMFDGVQLLAVNPSVDLESGGGVSIVLTEGEVPLRDGVARGVALDLTHSAPDLVEGAARAVAPGGRLVAPASAPLPAGVRELARDELEWVAERLSEPVVVPLRRG